MRKLVIKCVPKGLYIEKIFNYKYLQLSHGLRKPSSGLSENPQRVAYPKELLAIGLREYHEIFFKPYRIIYRVMAENVYVLVIADGRRTMQTLLQRRLLQALALPHGWLGRLRRTGLSRPGPKVSGTKLAHEGPHRHFTCQSSGPRCEVASSSIQSSSVWDMPFRPGTLRLGPGR